MSTGIHPSSSNGLNNRINFQNNINPIKYSCFYTYRLPEHEEKLHFVHRGYVCVSYNSQYEQIISLSAFRD